MARKRKKAGSELDRLYAKLTSAAKQSRGKVRWRKGSSYCAPESKSKRPCVTEYVSKAGKKVKVKTSRTASFGMPKRLASISHLRGAKGVAVPRALGKKFRFKKKRRVSRHVSAAKRAARGRSALFAAARRISTGR